jgi:hypothetical protein
MRKNNSSDKSKNGAPPNEGEMAGQLMHHPRRQDLHLILLRTIGTLLLLSINQGSTSGLEHNPRSLSAVVAFEKVLRFDAFCETQYFDKRQFVG